MAEADAQAQTQTQTQKQTEMAETAEMAEPEPKPEPKPKTETKPEEQQQGGKQGRACISNQAKKAKHRDIAIAPTRTKSAAVSQMAEAVAEAEAEAETVMGEATSPRKPNIARISRHQTPQGQKGTWAGCRCLTKIVRSCVFCGSSPPAAGGAGAASAITPDVTALQNLPTQHYGGTSNSATSSSQPLLFLLLPRGSNLMSN
eukprot:COSAG02_NODE_16965_length_1040_cov_0.904357_1_plen_202_part_00